MLMILLGAPLLWARPALSIPRRIQQPDGSFVTVRLVGDEYRHYYITDDGYALTRTADGTFVYAQKDFNGQLAPTRLVAHDAKERTSADATYLQMTGRLKPEMTSAMKQMMRQNMEGRSKVLATRRAGRYDYSKFRGLVILVEFNDCPFRYDDYKDIMTHMINDDNYQGESRTNLGAVKCTGSMRDYFNDNSHGLFKPTFDIVGPVQINYSQYQANTSTLTTLNIMKKACEAADQLVNFKDYDVDNDGTVDMVYLIFSGLPSYIEGNDSRLLWPHQADMRAYGAKRLDDVSMGRYACSTELYGDEEVSVLEGIGTMCHEFSHVLGLPDFYDADYEENGTCVHPGLWSVMAGGADFNYGRTPCNYSLFERYALGFATPQEITEPGEFSLEQVGSSNTGYRINTTVKNEFFFIENRQNVKWDSQLPGHGMLIFRVDSTNSSVWAYNEVNNNPNHPYYELLRAGGVKYYQGTRMEVGSDPFPGTAGVTTINNSTSPANLRTWAGKISPLGLSNIKEKNGIITFNAYDTNVLTSLILPEQIKLGVGMTQTLVPTREPEEAAYTLEWTSDNKDVATVDANGQVTGVSPGTAHITVTGNGTVTAVCEVTVLELTKKNNMADFRSMDEGSEAMLMLNDAEVLFVYTKGKTIYVRDASGALAFNATGLSAKVGDRLNGFIYGKLQTTNRIPTLTAVADMTSTIAVEVTAGSDAPLPHECDVANISDANLCDLIVLRGRTLTQNQGIWTSEGDKRIRIFNTFGLSKSQLVVPTSYDGKFFDVTGILTTRLLNDEVIYELGLTTSPVEVESQGIKTAPATTQESSASYNLSGMRVNDQYRGIVIRNGRKTVVK